MKSIFDYLFCARDFKNVSKHVSKDPILLNCGHSLCKTCLSATKIVDCGICGETNNQNVSVPRVSELIKCLINNNLDELIRFVCNKFKENFQNLCETYSNFDNSVQDFVILARGEIKQRIDSLKKELDNLTEQLYDEITAFESDYKLWKNENLSYFNQFDEVYFKQQIKSLEDKISQKINFTATDLYSYEESIKKLIEMKEEFIGKRPSIQFEKSKAKICKNLIGSIKRVNIKDTNTYLNVRIKSGKYIERFKTLKPINDICVLPNGSLLVAYDCYLKQYFDDMRCIKTIDTFQNVKGIDTDNDTAVYLSTQKSILQVTTDFQLTASYGGISDVSSSSKNMEFINYHLEKTLFTESVVSRDKKLQSGYNFQNACGLKFHNQNVYVCDTDTKMLVILNKDLSKVNKEVRLNFHPYNIKIIDKMGFISSNDNVFYFINIDDFQVLFELKSESAIMGQIGNSIYLYNSNYMLMYYYDLDDSLIKSIRTRVITDLQTTEGSDKGTIIEFNDKIVVAKHNSCFLVFM